MTIAHRRGQRDHTTRITMFEYIIQPVHATLIQVRWLVLEGVDVRHIDVTKTSRIALPPVATSSETNSATPWQRPPSKSRIPTPMTPRQYDAHVRAYRRYVAQGDKEKQKEEIERRTILRAGLKVKAKPVTITAKPIRIEEKTSLKNKYIVKLPVTRVNEVTTPIRQLPTPVKRDQSEWSQ